MRIRKKHARLTSWQIAALDQLISEELGRRADDGPTPWVLGLQSLAATLAPADEITATTKEVRP